MWSIWVYDKPLFRGLSAEFSATQLVSNMTDKFVQLLLDKPEIIDCVSGE